MGVGPDKKRINVLSLRAFLVRMIWLCVLPLLVPAVYLAVDHLETLKAKLDRDAGDRAQYARTIIDRHLRAHLNTMRILAASPRADSRALLKDFYREAQVFHSVIGSHIVLADISKQMLFNTRVPFGTALPKLPRPKGHASAPEVLETGKPAVGDIVFGPVAKEPLITVVVPVSREGRTQFLLLSAIETRQFQERLDEIALPAGWSLTLLDGRGEVMGHRGPFEREYQQADVGADKRFTVKSALSYWTVVLSVPSTFYYAPIVKTAMILVAAILFFTFLSNAVGRLMGQRLAQAVKSLAGIPSSGPSRLLISEIEEVRTLLMNAKAARETAELMQRESEEKYRLIADSTDDWVYWVGPDGDLRYTSPSCERVTGYSIDEFVNQPQFIKEIVHPEDKRALEEHASIAHGENEHGELEFRIITKTGKIRWIEHSCSPIYTPEGLYAGRRGTNRNITERKRIDDLLYMSEERLKEAQRIAQIGSWELDSRGSTLFWSDEICNILEIDPSLLGGTFEVYLDLVYPDDRERVGKVYAESIKNGSSFDIDYRLLMKDGRIKFVQERCKIVLDQKGNIIRSIGTVQDISERKTAERALLYQERLLRDMGRIAKVGGWEFDPATGKGTWTEEVARIHDLDPNDPASAELGLSFYHGESRLMIERAVREGINLGKPYDLELEMVTAKGVHKWVHTIGHPTIENGKVVLLSGSFQDVTERKRIEDEIKKINAELEQRVAERTAQLEAANKELEAFSYSVSHDLRAPLRHIGGYADLLIKRFPDSLPEKGRHYLNVIVDSVHQMGELIDDLLQFSRTGRQEMRQADLDMDDIVREALKAVEHDNAERNIEWIVAALPHVSGDRALIRLVWLNLLSNAAKFTRTRENAVIDVGVLENDREFIFFVRDNGVGFDMRYAHKLFGVFQRLHPAADFEGTGIGLANVRRIVLRHSGRTWAEADLDKGAVFYFALPKYLEG